MKYEFDGPAHAIGGLLDVKAAYAAQARFGRVILPKCLAEENNWHNKRGKLHVCETPMEDPSLYNYPSESERAEPASKVFDVYPDAISMVVETSIVASKFPDDGVSAIFTGRRWVEKSKYRHQTFPSRAMVSVLLEAEDEILST